MRAAGSGDSRDAGAKPTSRFDMPRDGDLLKIGPISLAGVAFAGTRGISKVENTSDGGSTWTTAPFGPPLSPLTWVLWKADFLATKEGALSLTVRATDGAGKVQDRSTTASYP